MADLLFYCPHCNAELVVDEAGTGLEIPCPVCAEAVVIPDRATAVEVIEPESEASDETAEEAPVTEEYATEEYVVTEEQYTEIEEQYTSAEEELPAVDPTDEDTGLIPVPTYEASAPEFAAAPGMSAPIPRPRPPMANGAQRPVVLAAPAPGVSTKPPSAPVPVNGSADKAFRRTQKIKLPPMSGIYTPPRSTTSIPSKPRVSHTNPTSALPTYTHVTKKTSVIVTPTTPVAPAKKGLSPLILGLIALGAILSIGGILFALSR